jgi:hypothetical protein
VVAWDKLVFANCIHKTKHVLRVDRGNKIHPIFGVKSFSSLCHNLKTTKSVKNDR